VAAVHYSFERSSDMKVTADMREIRELDARTNDGVEVRLLWHPESECVAVEVIDSRRREQFAFEVERANALDAFHHPYVYATAVRDGLQRELEPHPLPITTRRKEVTT
jgi:hypothetical protein